MLLLYSEEAVAFKGFTAVISSTQSSRLRLVLAPFSLKERIKEKHKLNRWHGTRLQCD